MQPPLIQCPNCRYDGGSHYFPINEDGCHICDNTGLVDEQRLYIYALRTYVIDEAIREGYKPSPPPMLFGEDVSDYF